MIVSDQHRADCVGYVNKYPVKTPNLDRLAAEGMWFSNAFTTVPTCCPARQSLLTGRTAESIGALWNYDITLPIASLSPQERTWTAELKGVGYQMGYIGKWHVSPVHSPLDFGYDYFYGVEDYETYLRNIAPDKEYNGKWEGQKDIVPIEDSRTHVFARNAIDKIKEFESSDSPWHIRLDLPEPHLPCCPSEHFFSMYSAIDIPQWHNFEENFEEKPYIQKQQLKNWGVENYTWEDWAPIVANYYGSISQCDDAIGRVLGVLEELGVIDNTIVIYTSDHGDMGGAHRMVDKHYVMYDDVVQVPLIIRMPGERKTKNLCHEFISHTLDLPPTILELAGLPVPNYLQGYSLLSLLKGNEMRGQREHVVASYHGAQFGLYCQRMIRTKEWKYIWNLTDVDELYCLEGDPGELKNLSDQTKYKEIQTHLKSRLYDHLTSLNDDILKTPWLSRQLLSAPLSFKITPRV